MTRVRVKNISLMMPIGKMLDFQSLYEAERLRAYELERALNEAR